MENTEIPNRIIRKIKSKAPCFSYGENFNRYPGVITEGHETGCQYKNVVIYIQNGHNNKKDFFEKLIKGISKIQSSQSRKYRLFIFGIGNSKQLQHNGKYFDLNYPNIKSQKKKIIEVFSEISQNKKCSKAIIYELFPKSQGKNFYTSRTKINKDDLLIIIGNKNEIFFNEDLKSQLKISIKKHILLIEFNNKEVNYTFYPKELNFNNLTNKNNSMTIKRYLSEGNLKRIKNDFKFLINLIDTSFGEFDFAIRDNYFNIYYKGNSLAKVEPKKNDFYKVSINAKFFDCTKADDTSFYTSKKDSNNIILSNKQLHRFFQRKHLTEFASRIKKVHNGEEIDFEQSLITDNLNKEKIIIIDRQITDTILKRKRLDLLALKQIEENKYQFLVMEVKLGNNPELKNKVASQLDGYLKHIQAKFYDYKKCYEKQFEQKRELGLIKKPAINKINIIEPVEGIILVGGYSGIAFKQINELKATYPHLKIKQFTNEI